DGTAVDLGRPGDEGVAGPHLAPRRAHAIDVLLRVAEAQRIDALDAAVVLAEAPLVHAQRHALAGGEHEVELALRADVELDVQVRRQQRLAATRTFGEHPRGNAALLV